MNVHQNWLENLKNFPGNLNLPSPTVVELKLEYLELNPPSKVSAKLPYQLRFSNPISTYQGGMLAAAFDEVYGALSFGSAQRPCTTISMNLTFLGPFREEHGHCFVEGTVLKQTKNFIFMRAEARSPTGELLAHSESHVKVL